ncbi:hypothetical protein C8039_19310 [Halogeometricum sp. wsp3]|nr:hypothetical protein C8039_19310 [Halogeometricum sp. wsp3]
MGLTLVRDSVPQTASSIKQQRLRFSAWRSSHDCRTTGTKRRRSPEARERQYLHRRLRQRES